MKGIKDNPHYPTGMYLGIIVYHPLCLSLYHQEAEFLSGGRLAETKFCNDLFRPAHFVRPGTVNRTPSGLKYLKHKFILFAEELLAAVIEAASITSFNVSCLSDRLSADDQVFKKPIACEQGEGKERGGGKGSL